FLAFGARPVLPAAQEAQHAALDAQNVLADERDSARIILAVLGVIDLAFPSVGLGRLHVDQDVHSHHAAAALGGIRIVLVGSRRPLLALGSRPVLAAAQKAQHAAFDAQGVVAGERDAARVVVAVLGVVDLAFPAIGAGRLHVVQDGEAQHGTIPLGRIGIVLVV